MESIEGKNFKDDKYICHITYVGHRNSVLHSTYSEKIFELFPRLHSVEFRNIPGTGIDCL